MTRRTVEEWITVARIAPSVGYEFVEGGSDARLLAEAFGFPEDVDFHDASEIDMILEDSHPYWGGFKLRLMKMAALAQGVLDKDNLACLVDRDFDELVSYANRLPSIYRTQFANLPVTGFNREWASAYLLKAYGFSVSNDIWVTIVNSLKISFICKYILFGSESPNSVPRLSEYIRSKKGHIEFDELGFVKRSFAKKPEIIDFVFQNLDNYKEFLEKDINFYASFHDVVDIMFGLLRSTKKISGSHPRESIVHSYFAAIDSGVIRSDSFLNFPEWVGHFTKNRQINDT